MRVAIIFNRFIQIVVSISYNIFFTCTYLLSNYCHWLLPLVYFPTVVIVKGHSCDRFDSKAYDVNDTKRPDLETTFRRYIIHVSVMRRLR